MQEKQDIARIPIEQVYPDPDQPRKRLPNDLAQAVSEGMAARALIQELRIRAETQAGLATFLKGLDDLATSIKQVGQLAPIRVYADKRKRFVIEMGERRWLAHLILHFERGESDFSHIDTIITTKRKENVEQQILQRRMAENVHRAEFSPIEMARSLMERINQVLRENSEMNHSKAEEFVGTENGITARRVRQYLSLLKLSDRAQQLAQENGLTERALRGVLKFHEPDAQVRAIQKLIAGEREKSESTRASVSSQNRAESFLQNMLELAQNKHEQKQFKRVLRVQLKQNPRARVFLTQLLQPNKQIHIKRAVSKNTGILNRARRLKNARRRNNEHRELLRPHKRDSRRGRRRR